MKENKNGFSIWTFLSCFFFILIVIRVCGFFCLGKIDVSGSSMMTTLQDGDKLLINRMAKPKRGDIVVIEVAKYKEEHLFNETTEHIIKRLIATEGDSLYCKNNTLYIQYAGTDSFVELEEDYVSSTTPNFKELTVGEGEIFFLGDNRAISKDSTEVGCLKTEDIYGTVIPFSINKEWLFYLF